MENTVLFTIRVEAFGCSISQLCTVARSGLSFAIHRAESQDEIQYEALPSICTVLTTSVIPTTVKSRSKRVSL
jgi:hypothetical protein